MIAIIAIFSVVCCCVVLAWATGREIERRDRRRALSARAWRVVRPPPEYLTNYISPETIDALVSPLRKEL